MWVHVAVVLSFSWLPAIPLFKLLILIDIWAFPVWGLYKGCLHEHSPTWALLHMCMHLCWCILRRDHVECLHLLTLLHNAK